MSQEYIAPYTKPLLDTNEQIEHLKSKGVQFHLMSEEEAYAYLEKIAITLKYVPIGRILISILVDVTKGSISIWILLCWWI